MGLNSFLKNKARVDFSDLDEKTKLNIKHCLENRRESLKLLRTTVDPKTFFDNFELWFISERSVLDQLSDVPASQSEREYPEILEFDTNPTTRSKYQIDFIRRALFAGKEEILKSQMPLYISKMTKDSIDYYENNIGSLSEVGDINKEYIFCSVVFRGTDRLYDYLTDDETIKPKDTVIVPVGYRNEEKIARVIKVQRFTEGEIFFSPDKVKYIIRKIED